jgi:hypothetical protein
MSRQQFELVRGSALADISQMVSKWRLTTAGEVNCSARIASARQLLQKVVFAPCQSAQRVSFLERQSQLLA